MLPAIVVILFCQGAMAAVGVVMAQKDFDRRTIAICAAIALGVLPAWQTAEVWNQATSPSSFNLNSLKY